MNGRALVWSGLFLAAGLLVATGVVGSAWSTGPRVGAATLLFVLALTTALAANAAWILRKTTNPEDYRGGCPVGATCSCGHFNFKPRKACRQCGAATAFA